MDPCAHHPTVPASWRCLGCDRPLCADCVRTQPIGGEQRGALSLCPDCGEPCAAARLRDSERTQAPGSFFGSLPAALVYPFRGRGGWVFAGGAAALLAAELVHRFLGPAGWVLALLVGGYLAGFLLAVVRASAGGEDQSPPWPPLDDVWEGILWPLVLVSAVGLTSFGPALLFGLWTAPAPPAAAPGPPPGSPPAAEAIDLDARFEELARTPRRSSSGPGLSARATVLVVLVLLGAAYAPMSLLIGAIGDSLAGLSPTLVLPSIARVPVAYAVTAAIALALTLSEALLEGALLRAFSAEVSPDSPLAITATGVAALALKRVVTLYTVMVLGRVLGLLFRHHGARLPWSSR